jgi:hypothetical protein
VVETNLNTNINTTTLLKDNRSSLFMQTGHADEIAGMLRTAYCIVQCSPPDTFMYVTYRTRFVTSDELQYTESLKAQDDGESIVKRTVIMRAETCS